MIYISSFTFSDHFLNRRTFKRGKPLWSCFAKRYWGCFYASVASHRTFRGPQQKCFTWLEGYLVILVGCNLRLIALHLQLKVLSLPFWSILSSRSAPRIPTNSHIAVSSDIPFFSLCCDGRLASSWSWPAWQHSGKCLMPMSCRQTLLEIGRKYNTVDAEHTGDRGQHWAAAFLSYFCFFDGGREKYPRCVSFTFYKIKNKKNTPNWPLQLWGCREIKLC